jgi:PTH1 family peptidyl-tRNA hydrolase
LVIGLGNPGPEYEKTRHNIGQLVLDQLSGGQKFSSHKSRMEICEVKCGEQTLVLAKSRGYMNETGGPAKALLDFYKIESTQVIAVHDELDLPFNALRIKQGGGDNGPNGLNSLTSSFSPADFVLKPFSKEERKDLGEFLTQGADAITALVLTGMDKAQTAFNS